MKITLAQLNFTIADFEGNYTKICNAINAAKKEKADLIIFPELAVCGYPPRDLLIFDDFVAQCESSINRIAKDADDIAVIIGSPSRNLSGQGNPLFNSAYFLAEGKIRKIIHKTLLPTYDIFDEARYFESNKKFEIINYKNTRIALTVCEDIWDIDEHAKYAVCPLDVLAKETPDFIVNIAGSPFDYEHTKERIHVLKINAKKYNLPIFYINHVGGQTDILFDGASLVINPDGSIYDELEYFEEIVKHYDLTKIITQGDKKGDEQSKDAISLIHDALIMGIRDYFTKLGLQKAIIGLSGGIDSSIVAVLAAKALGNKNVHCLLMPSKFSSKHSIIDAEVLTKNLNISYDIIHIQETVNKYYSTLEPWFKGTAFDVTEENIQARVRGMLLMAFCNEFEYIYINSSNKSEMAIGYGTLYADLAGGLSVIGDVYKTQVYELGRYINKKEKSIPENIFSKPSSAELRPNQRDIDDLPAKYEILDKIFYQYIEKQKDFEGIVSMGFDKHIVEKTLKLINQSEYKRYQTPPVLRVSSKAFGIGRRIPIAAKY